MQLRIEKAGIKKYAVIASMLLLVGCATPQPAAQPDCDRQVTVECPQQDEEEKDGPDGFLMFAVIGAIVVIGITIHGS